MSRRPSRTELTGRTRRARLARTVGPEVVAAVISVLVIAVFGLVLSSRGPGGSPSPTDPTPTPLSTSTPSQTPSAALSTSPVPSPGPSSAAWAAQATAVLEAAERLDAVRDRLTTALAATPVSANAIARELRAMNTTLTGALDAIGAMAANGAPGALVDDLRTAHEATLAVSLETLQASVQNVPAYQAGGTESVALLDTISALAERVRTQAGLPSAAP